MSARLSTTSPRACSGDIYAAVPRMRPFSVIDTVAEPVAGPWVAFASPKSRIFTTPSRVTLMLAGFRSRWTMPFSCAPPLHPRRYLPGVADRGLDGHGSSEVGAFHQFHHQIVGANVI